MFHSYILGRVSRVASGEAAEVNGGDITILSLKDEVCVDVDVKLLDPKGNVYCDNVHNDVDRARVQEECEKRDERRVVFHCLMPASHRNLNVTLVARSP